MQGLGRHLLLELFDCDLKIIGDLEMVRAVLIESAKHARVTVVDAVFHEFNPHGITGVVVIAESHISIHTWPEHFYAAADIFTCGNKAMPHIAATYIAKEFRAKRTSVMEIVRPISQVQRSAIDTVPPSCEDVAC